MRRYTLRALLCRLLCLAAFCVVLLGVLRWGRGCPFRGLTGIPCPGCGMSRAWLAALRLDMTAAFRYHPMFWSVPVLMLYSVFDGQLFRQKWLNFGLLGLIAIGTLVHYLVILIAALSGNPVV